MASEGRSDLVIEDLVKTFPGGVQAVDHVSLRIREGQFVTLLGPSGCGKTTTLNCIAGLEQPDGGRITVGRMVLTDVGRGVLLPPERRDLGMVFQSYALWPHMTVYDNLAFGLRLRRVPASEIRQRIRETLELVGLAGLERRYPFELSGGQQQRVALARAVVVQPRVLLLDEPLSNLDAKVREAARFWLREFQQRLGITAVYVTHDQAEALAISDQVAVMAQGRLLQYAPPTEVYERPASRFVAEFIGQTSFLQGTVVERSPAALRVTLEGGGPTLTSTLVESPVQRGERVVVAVRAERVELLTSAPEGETNLLPATLRSGIYLGASYEYLLSTPWGEVRALSRTPVPGPSVLIRLPPTSLVVLADDRAVAQAA
jgi:iron(III) transport system ATP-binding protein